MSDLMSRMIEQRAKLRTVFIQVSVDLDQNNILRLKNINIFVQNRITALNNQTKVQGLGSLVVFAINIGSGIATTKFNISDGLVKGASEVGRFGTDMGVRSFEGDKIRGETRQQIEFTQIQKANELSQSYMRAIDPQAERTAMQIFYSGRNQ